MSRVGQNRIYIHIWCSFGSFSRVSPNIRSYTVYILGIIGRKITKYTVIYSVHIQSWPTLTQRRYLIPHPQHTHQLCQLTRAPSAFLTSMLQYVAAAPRPLLTSQLHQCLNCLSGQHSEASCILPCSYAQMSTLLLAPPPRHRPARVGTKQLRRKHTVFHARALCGVHHC